VGPPGGGVGVGPIGGGVGVGSPKVGGALNRPGDPGSGEKKKGVGVGGAVMTGVGVSWTKSDSDGPTEASDTKLGIVGAACGGVDRYIAAPPPMNRKPASNATPRTSAPPPPPPVGSAMTARLYPWPLYFAARGSRCRHRLQKVAPDGLRRPQLGQINVYPQSARKD
jgi:hypothetical protein